MTITSPVSPPGRALSPVVEAGSKLETEPGTIDVSWAERALRDAEGPKEVTLRETAARHRWLKLLAMAVVLCACTATGAVTNQTSPIPPAPVHQRRAAPPAVHRVPASVKPSGPRPVTSPGCPFSQLARPGANGDAVPSGKLSCRGSWSFFLPFWPPAETPAPLVGRTP